MDNIVFFNNIPHLGNLFLDYVFNEFNMEPILFTVRDSEYNLYICLCYEMRDSLEWIISKISNEDLANLINKKKSIKEVFLSDDNMKKIIKISDIEYKVTPFDFSKDDELLPENKVVLRCNFELAKEYLENTLNRIKIEFSFEQPLVSPEYDNNMSEVKNTVSRVYKRESMYDCNEKSLEIRKNSKNFFAA